MKKLLFSLGIAGALLLGVAQPTAAISLPPAATQFAACERKPIDFLGFESWDACLKTKYGGKVQLNELADIWLIVLPLFNDALKATTLVATGLVIWGGVQLLKSQGDPMNIKNARNTIKNAIIGLLICLLSISMVQFISAGFIK